MPATGDDGNGRGAAPVLVGTAEPPRAADTTRFMLVSTQRSGSTWVVDSLNSHPEIVCYDTLFLPRHSIPPAGPQDRTRFATYRAENDPDTRRRKVPALAWRYLDEVYEHKEGASAVGFKFMYSQFRTDPWVLAYARAKGIRIIHLVRQNKLEHVLSKDSAIARGQYHALPGDSLITPPIHLDPQHLVSRLEREERKVKGARVILSLLRLHRLDVTYEDLLSDNERFADILRFLGVDPRVDLLRSSFQRWSRGTQEERIANYVAVKRALEGTRFGRLLSS